MPRAHIDPRIQTRYALKLAKANESTRAYWLGVAEKLKPAVAQAEARRRGRRAS